MKRYKPIDGQISMFHESVEKAVDNSETPLKAETQPKNIITKPGDLWHIGNHRLLCGDSANPTDMKKLLSGAKMQMVHCDPPYNVCVQPQSKDKTSAKSRKLKGDFLPSSEFLNLLYMWFHHVSQALEPGNAFYIWGGYSNIVNYPSIIKSAGLYYSHGIVWVKDTSVFTRKDFMGKYEICFYGWKVGAPHKFFGPNNIPDVWEVPNIPRTQMIHLTEKPVEIPLRAIKCSSEEGDNVLDIFGGSGSTLIAADQLKRTCYLMEIDPWYCDVIVKRCKGLGVPIERE